ncbi:MAG: hypothetical protein R2839_05885 [Thermomicrobiales bacterium]
MASPKSIPVLVSVFITVRSSGKPRNVVGAVIDMYYPAGTPVRVPVVAVASGDESEEIASRIAGFLTIGGQSVGLAIPDRAVINGVAAHPRPQTFLTGSTAAQCRTELAVIREHRRSRISRVASSTGSTSPFLFPEGRRQAMPRRSRIRSSRYSKEADGLL